MGVKNKRRTKALLLAVGCLATALIATPAYSQAACEQRLELCTKTRNQWSIQAGQYKAELEALKDEKALCLASLENRTKALELMVDYAEGAYWFAKFYADERPFLNPMGLADAILRFMCNAEENSGGTE